MMGYGFYGNIGGGGSSPSSSSSLSASAPPFTVDRFSSKSPLMDLTDPITYGANLNLSSNNWVHPNPQVLNSRPDFFRFDTIPSRSAAFGFPPVTSHVPSLNHPLPPALNDGVLHGQGKTSLAEGEYYNPWVLSPTVSINDPMNGNLGYDLLSPSCAGTSNGSSHLDYTGRLSSLEHTAPQSGLWEGATDWQQSKKVQLDGNYANQGSSASKSMDEHEETTHSINNVDMEKHEQTAISGRLNCESLPWDKPKVTATDYPTTSALVFPSVVPQTYPPTPSTNAATCTNNQLPYIPSYSKCSRKRDTSPSDRTTLMKSSPAVVIKEPRQDTCTFKKMNTGSNGMDKEIAGNNPSNLKEPNPFRCSEGKGRFDASQLRFHLEQNDDCFVEFSSKRISELPSRKNVSADFLDHFFKAEADSQVPHRNLDCFNMGIDNHETTASVEHSAESLDRYNPAVDSPCWKGAPVSRLSPFEVSEILSPQNMKKLEACNGLNPQGPQISLITSNDGLKASTEKPSESLFHCDNGSPENCLAPSFERPLVADVLFREGIADAVGSGPHEMQPHYCHGVKISDDFDEPKKENKPRKSINDSDFQPLHTKQQSLEDGKGTSETNQAQGASVADVVRKINYDRDDCSSHVPFHAIEQVLCSPTSSEDTPTKHTQLHGVESSSRLPTRTLIETMRNLSELLLFYSLDDACELKEEDYEALKEVIKSLDACISKNKERKTSAQESSIPQRASSRFPGKLPELCKAQPERRPIENEEEKIVSGKTNQKLSNYVSARYAADTVKDDRMTQAIKKVLSENFPGEEEPHPQSVLYKNLWLEAEASLCSVNYMTRFNRMKIEMEKCNSQNANDFSSTPSVLPENTMIVENPSRSKTSSDQFTANKLPADNKGTPVPDVSLPDSSILSRNSHADDIMARFHILSCRDNSNSVNASSVEQLLSSRDSADLKNIENLDYDAKDSTKPDISIQDSTMSSTASHAGDVMARFHILKCQVDNSVNASAVEKFSCLEVSPDENKVDKLTHQAEDSKKLDLSHQDSPISSTSSHVDDVEGSVMARLLILKQRDGNSSSMDVEKLQSEDVDLGYTGLRRHYPIRKDRLEDRILDVNMEPVFQNYTANSLEDKSMLKEFCLSAKDGAETHPRLTTRLGDQPHAAWYDSSSSDWEHVLKEELAGQSC